MYVTTNIFMYSQFYFTLIYFVLRGDTFRPSYEALGSIRSHFENVPMLLLSATLSESLRCRTLDILHIDSEDIHEVFELPDR